MWAAAVAAALLPLTVVELVRAARLPADLVWLATCIALFTVLHAAVVVRRSLPRTALVVASAAMLGLVVASLPGTPFVAMLQPSSAVFVVFVYTAAAGDDRWADAGALVTGLVGAALMTGVAMAHGFAPEPDPGVGPIIALAGFLVASIGASWALGRYRRESRRTRAAQEFGREQAAQLRLQAERSAVADERRRIARELHDVISHSLAVMVAQAEASRVLVGRDDERARTAVEHVVATGREAMTDMRGLLAAFGDPGADGGRGAAESAALEPGPHLTQLPRLIAGARGADRHVTLVEVGEPRPASPALELTAYRVVQESLTNVMKHTAPPTRTEVRVEWSTEAVEVTVDDDGGAVDDDRAATGSPSASAISGPRPAPVPVSGGGLLGLADRVVQVGGRFMSGRRPDGGWRTTATLPLAAAERAPEPTAQVAPEVRDV